MSLQQQLAADLRLRAALLPEETADWKTRTRGDVGGMGLHFSQVKAVDLVLDGLQARQSRLLGGLEPSLPAEEFAETRSLLESELNAAHGIAAVFRYILNQRGGQDHFGPALDCADRVAADCYRPTLDRAAAWGALPKERHRVPPLTYFHTAGSALALSRRSTIAKIGLKIEGHSELKLPVPVIALPFHQSVAPWTFCGIYHEVGHLLDQDLNLSSALAPRLRARLKAARSPHAAAWEFWLPELIADVFGVLYGGAAFGTALASLLFSPEQQAITIVAGDEHPPAYLRILLLAALLRATRAPALATAADEIEQTWCALYAAEPPELAPYVQERELVAATLLDERLLAELKSHALRELAPDLAQDTARVAELSAYLAAGQGPPRPQRFPVRLVPAAAQRAVDAETAADEERLRAIQQRTFEFVGQIPRPRTMDIGDFPAARQTYLRGLVDQLDFSILES